MTFSKSLTPRKLENSAEGMGGILPRSHRFQVKFMILQDVTVYVTSLGH